MQENVMDRVNILIIYQPFYISKLNLKSHVKAILHAALEVQSSV